MRSFSINFPSIALIPVAFFVIFLSIFIISELGFSLEAYYRGYDVNEYEQFKTTNLQILEPVDIRIGSCYINDVGTTFCKDEYGMLGWKQWFTPNEQKEIIDKFPTLKIEPKPENFSEINP